MKRVVVTGLGAITPIGNTLPSYWEGLISGKSGAAPITLFDAEKFKTRFACEVKDFNAEDFMHRREARRMDRFAHFAMVAATEAMEDSGIDVEKINLDRAGVIWGAGIGGLGTLQNEITTFAQGDGKPRYNPFLIPKMIIDIAPGLISIKYGFRGMNYATVSACASSSHALINACDYIKLGKADIIITGGSEAAITKTGVGGFTSMKAMSESNDTPATASRPFDGARNGFVLGEGGASIILEEYEHAKKRGAKIYAEILGSGMTADAYHITAPHPEGISVSNVMRLALEDSNITTADVDYINVHGTSTPLGDIAEVKAIKEVFGEAAYDLNISSTKSMTGHLLGAAGAVEAVACILAIKHGIVPPTINHTTNDPDIDNKLNFTFNEAQTRDVKVAISNTFGFGGHNTSVVFRKID
ncbi:MAG: 3-oxoacyl-[acyl-carrier-protein] synthase II [Maribacter sp.]|jgi:3-oxoacyl-[acyl-carrier-protein] synthase II